MAFEGWRVAMKRYADSVKPENVRRVDRHNETNEVFILTAGKADLIALDDDGYLTQSLEELAAATTANARKLFGIAQPPGE